MKQFDASIHIFKGLCHNRKRSYFPLPFLVIFGENFAKMEGRLLVMKQEVLLTKKFETWLSFSSSYIFNLNHNI